MKVRFYLVFFLMLASCVNVLSMELVEVNTEAWTVMPGTYCVFPDGRGMIRAGDDCNDSAPGCVIFEGEPIETMGPDGTLIEVHVDRVALPPEVVVTAFIPVAVPRDR